MVRRAPQRHEVARRRAIRVACALAVSGGVVVAACVDPTQIQVEITTDIPCDKLSGTEITVGRLGELDGRRAPTAATQTCQGGRIGGIVIVPSRDPSDEVGIAVVTGIDGTAVDTCRPPYKKGCVVARRALRFAENTDLRVNISVRRVCDGNPCLPVETCRVGSCVSAVLASSSPCTDPRGCGEEALGPK
jgi:hypothetical protein